MRTFDLYRRLQCYVAPSPDAIWMRTTKVGRINLFFTYPVENSLRIEWGDGTHDTFTGGYNNKSHTYSKNGTKNIVCSGTGYTGITGLHCNSNALTELNVSANAALMELFCELNNLTSLDISSNTNLTWLNCAGCYLSSSAINSILASLVAHGKTNGHAYLFYQNPSAPPTGQGLTDKATLISRGWTVTTD